jgi:MFS family permease
MSVMPLTNGLAFLEKTPSLYECRQVSANRMSDLVSDHKSSWKTCTVKEICAMNLPQKDYRANKSDPEYLDNWVPKLDMLCKPQSEIGLLGSFFFLGAMLSIFWVPKYADTKGRKNIILLGLVVQVATCIAFIVNKSLKGAAILMIVLGMVHPTKNIVFFNYAVEVMPSKHKQLIVNIVMTLDSMWIILLCISYQYIDVSWRFL